MLRLPIAILPILLCSSCFIGESHRHRPLAPDVVAALDPGVSTASDVVAALGAPTEVVQLGHRSAYRYDYGVEKQTGLFLLVVALTRVESAEDRTWLFFDAEGVLTHVGATFESGEAEFGLPDL